MDKKQNRLRRARKARAKIRELEANRLTIHRTPRHIYAQVIGSSEGQVIASASTLEAEVRKGVKNGGNVAAAAIVGARIAEKAKAAGVDSVAFDRSGFRYHGRVKALADAAREAGLKF
ncbi:MAG: 50S ribosomal protein L18 [Gammaproteobacteria bacterium]|nr:50S ribosomal protein L18 [Gammaproteobacteria bacterium]NNL51904.1 50S ribosomal protein L18 [Woeseiaceae bacterium]